MSDRTWKAAKTVSVANDAALEALFVPFELGQLEWPADGRVLFLRARTGTPLQGIPAAGWVFEQSFRPFAEGLERAGFRVASAAGERFPLVLLLPPRQRDESRALLARALQHVAPGGRVVASMLNTDGARSGEADLAQLAGTVHGLPKNKCRVFWTDPLDSTIDAELVAAWAALDAPRAIGSGRFSSRPGLFAWDHVDPASELLAGVLPADLAGRGADLGAGFGFLAAEVLTHCPRVTALDLYDAEARALELARENLARLFPSGDGGRVALEFHWHDVTTGLPKAYDFIVTNPPFHLGSAEAPGVGRGFIAAAASALVPHGRLWLVANRHLPYEAELAARFARVRVVLEAGGYKVIEAIRAPQVKPRKEKPPRVRVRG